MREKQSRFGLHHDDSDAVRYKTVTRKRLLSFDEPTQREMLRALYQENINRLKRDRILRGKRH
jgi:UV DNA damage repair endonuclease